MVGSVTSFGRSGVYDWVVQRASAVILALYTFFMLGYFLLHPEIGYEQWSALFSGFGMKVFSLLALLSLCAHAWVGMWTIATDYLTPGMVGRGATLIRFAFLAGCGLLTFIYLLWGIQILWGV
ncbi:MAG: succinate dehydrogenase, hydrophobic membrane anchor protein [Pseudohongiellaceae bacterium]